jgi:protein phosphatase
MIRDNNEDKFDLVEPYDPLMLASKGCFFGVADGMGGHSAGQIASELALKTVIQCYYTDPQIDIVDSLCRAIGTANTVVYEASQEVPERQGMGTTLVCCVLWGDKLVVAHVGDSRAYLVRDGVAHQVTSDHSLVAEQVRLGAMTAEEAANSSLRNIILRSVGTGPGVESDIEELLIAEGDIIVLCSDGLTGHVASEEIAAIVSSPIARLRGPSVAAHRLVNLANARGGKDNITALVVEVAEMKPFKHDMEGLGEQPDFSIFEPPYVG